MNYIALTKENLEREHICCAISNNKDPQVAAKKAWLMDRLGEGLVFLKAEERGKCFIEYIPAEYAWSPIDAEGYLFINCFWVSGALKGHGYANDLLERCIADAKAQGKRGLCVVSSPKKQPFLSDPAYLAHRGFRCADTAEPFFTLLYLPFREDAPAPKFKPCAKKPHVDAEGFALYYTAGCPYTAKYAPLIAEAAEAAGIPFHSVSINTREAAQNAPVAWTNYALFYCGEFVTNEILSEKKFLLLAEKLKEGRMEHGK